MPLKLPAMLTLLTPIRPPNLQMSTAATSNRISHILELVGPPVLLAWPCGSKGNRRKWKHIQLTDMNDNRYLAGLKKAGKEAVITIDYGTLIVPDSFIPTRRYRE